MTSDDVRGCSVDGCPRKHSAMGYCAMHYQAYRSADATCGVCGAPISSANGRRYCTRACYYLSLRTNVGVCSVAGCAKPASIAEMCPAHYKRLSGAQHPCEICGETVTARRSRTCSRTCGNVLAKGPVAVAIRQGDAAALLDSLRDATDRNGDTGCWLWRGKKDSKGYARTTGPDGRVVGVHRIALEARLGRSLGREQAHHRCANASCVNPDHLEPVTVRENVGEMMQRGFYLARIAELEEALREYAPDHELLA